MLYVILFDFVMCSDDRTIQDLEMMRSVKSNSAIENRKPFESKRYSEFVNGLEKHSSSNK